MKIEARSIGGERLIFVALEPQLAMSTWYHLSLAQVDPLSTIAGRQMVAPLIAGLARALVACDYIDLATLNDFAKHLREKPSEALDQHSVVQKLQQLEELQERPRD